MRKSTSSAAARQRNALAAASSVWLVRLFFAAAGAVAVVMAYYSYSAVITDGKADLAASSTRLGGPGAALPPRAGHGGHLHSHEAPVVVGDAPAAVAPPPVHEHEHPEHEAPPVDGEPPPNEYAERFLSRIDRKVMQEKDGRRYIHEKQTYSVDSEEEALALANELVKDGIDVAVQEGEDTPSEAPAEEPVAPQESTPPLEVPAPVPVPVGAEGGSGGEVGAKVAPWAELTIPTWSADLVGRQRPVAGEAAVTSHGFEESTVHSLNPPLAAGEAGYNPEEVQELEHRIVLAVALGVHSGSVGATIAAGDKDALSGLPIIKVLLNTMLPVAQAHFVYRFYFAFDHNDGAYEKAANRDAVSAMYVAAFAAEDAKRWHPQGSQPGVIDGSRLVVSVHWVHCDYSGKPSWAHSDAVVAAYKEGADYAYRSNDDSAFPSNPDWGDRFITELRSRVPIPNLGVTGPTCNEGAVWILTHDFTHKTHAVIFDGLHYPRSLPDWSSDDWSTLVYGSFGLMSKIPDVVTAHTFAMGTRYEPTNQGARLAALNAELNKGAVSIAAWAKVTHRQTLSYTVKTVTCC